MTSPDLTGVDFGDHAVAPSSDKLEQLTALVRELEIAEVAVSEAAAVLAQRSARMQGIVEHELPELMLELKQPILHTSDGRKIQVKDVVRASLPEASRPKGHAWMMEHGHGGNIKRTVEVAFAASEGKRANDLLDNLETEFGANARQTMKVESSTLTAFVKKRLVAEAEEGFEGEALPRDIFQIREFKHAKVSKK
jgi:hypothetical protein